MCVPFFTCQCVLRTHKPPGSALLYAPFTREGLQQASGCVHTNQGLFAVF